MKVEVLFRGSDLVSVLLKDKFLQLDSRMCLDELHFPDDSQGYNVFPRFVFVYVKEKGSSKPVTYSFHHVLIEVQCESLTKKGLRCRNTSFLKKEYLASEQNFCPLHRSIKDFA